MLSTLWSCTTFRRLWSSFEYLK